MHVRTLVSPAVLVLCCFVASALSSCGPVNSNAAIQQAEKRLAEARETGVQNTKYKAGYHYLRAELYLHKAKEEEGYAEFQHAVAFANQAEREAKYAIEQMDQEKRSKAADEKRSTAKPAPKKAAPAKKPAKAKPKSTPKKNTTTGTP